MSNRDDNHPPRNNVIRFPVEAVSRFGFKRAEKRRGSRIEKMELEGQMTLFSKAGENASESCTVVPFPLQMSPFEEALMLDELGDERAAEVYVNAIEDGDHPADAWCNLGVLRSVGGDMETAFDCFAQSVATDPHHAESHYNLANLYFEMSDLRLARTHYEIALDTSPEFTNAWFNYGLVTALAEDYQTAFDALTRYKALTPGADEGVADEILGYIRTAINLS